MDGGRPLLATLAEKVLWINPCRAGHLQYCPGPTGISEALVALLRHTTSSVHHLVTYA